MRIVLTGGPGAGKTAVSAGLAAERPDRFVRVPEAATQVYDALRTRWDLLDLPQRRDVQRRIYHLQIEQEEQLAAASGGRILLLDRGTIDGAAYWPEGPADYWRDLGTTHERELARYHTVVWMQTCAAVPGAYDGSASNPCRFEDPAAALRSGERLADLWAGHSRLRRVEAYRAFDEKYTVVRKVVAELIGPTPSA